MILAPDIAKQIKRAAKEKGVALQEMLEACGLSKNALSSMTAGSYPKVDNLIKIADYLSVSIDVLLSRGAVHSSGNIKMEAFVMSNDARGFLNLFFSELSSVVNPWGKNVLVSGFGDDVEVQLWRGYRTEPYFEEWFSFEFDENPPSPEAVHKIAVNADVTLAKISGNEKEFKFVRIANQYKAALSDAVSLDKSKMPEAANG